MGIVELVINEKEWLFNMILKAGLAAVIVWNFQIHSPDIIL